MIGAIVGDIIGSIYEGFNIKTKKFKIFEGDYFSEGMRITDDSVCTVAVAKAIAEWRKNNEDKPLSYYAKKNVHQLCNEYPRRGYGGRFSEWYKKDIDEAKPYNSLGNGAIMRVSACGMFAKSKDEAVYFSQEVTGITHNHPSAMKWAEVISVMIYELLHGMSMYEFKKKYNKYYPSESIDDIRKSYKFDVTCDGTAPYAIKAFVESVSYVDAVRNAVSLGGDSDTIAAITGSLAEAYYNDKRTPEGRSLGIPSRMKRRAIEMFFYKSKNAPLEAYRIYKDGIKGDVELSDISSYIFKDVPFPIFNPR